MTYWSYFDEQVMDENLFLELERRKIVTPTFRRLDPAKRERIYRAALASFANDRYDRVSLDDVAASAKVSKGSLIQYFSSKENLLYLTAAVTIDLYREFSEEYFKKENEVRARQRLLTYLIAQYDFWLESDDRLGFLLRYLLSYQTLLPDDMSIQVVDRMRDNLEIIIDDGVNGGEIRRDTSIERIMLIVLSLQDGIMREISYDIENLDREALYNSCLRIIDLLFDGFGGERRIRTLPKG